MELLTRVGNILITCLRYMTCHKRFPFTLKIQLILLQVHDARTVVETLVDFVRK